jgi:cytochrome P450
LSSSPPRPWRRGAAPLSAHQRLLDALIVAADGADALTDQEVRDQVVSLIAGDYETTAALAAWTAYAVLSNSGVNFRLTQDLDSLGDKTPAEQLESCAYLDAVVNEALRLYGPAAISARYAPEAVDMLGYRIPARSRVVYSGYVTHRLPELWEEPLTFDPARWVDTPAPDPYAFVPLGGVYRRCIGFAMATLETKILVAELLRSTSLTLHTSQATPTGWAAMYPKGGIVISATACRR